MKKTLTMIMATAMLGMGGLTAPAAAQGYDSMPTDFRYATVDYVESRLVDSRGARIVYDSDPYPVYADFGRNGAYDAWAVDIRVRARTGSGYGGYTPYTVIFVDGEPVAFESDIGGVEVARSARFAGRR